MSLSGGRFVISLDFELHWGVADLFSIDDYRSNLLGVRQVVPRLLRLFNDNGIHATWATVGMLLARTKKEALEAAPLDRPSYTRSRYSNYSTLAAAGDDEASDPFHFAHSLVSMVVAARGQELATHTFSHYYCLEAGQTLAEFKADLQAALAITQRNFGVAVKSIVFPRNQFAPEHLRVCTDLGIRAYRGNPRNWLSQPRAHSEERAIRRAGRLVDAYLPICRTSRELPRSGHVEGIVDVTASRFLRPASAPLRALEPLRLRRILSEMDAAAAGGGVYHLWWHPHNFGTNLEGNVACLSKILSHYRQLNRRRGMKSATMAEIAAELLGNA